MPKFRPYEEKTCQSCGVMFGPRMTNSSQGRQYLNWPAWDRAVFCSHACVQYAKSVQSVIDGHTWKNAKGYVFLRLPQHPSARGRDIPEHRLVMERKLGRLMREGESVHHINGIRDDNRPENLELWSVSQPWGQRVSDKACAIRIPRHVGFRAGRAA